MTMPSIVLEQLLLGLLHVHTTGWFRPFSQHRRHCQLPVSGRRTQQLLQFRLCSHQLPSVRGRLAGGQHVARANRVCTHCGSVAVQMTCT